jgi:hypothetical protein
MDNMKVMQNLPRDLNYDLSISDPTGDS